VEKERKLKTRQIWRKGKPKEETEEQKNSRNEFMDKEEEII
jgi:hypothetical protein